MQYCKDCKKELSRDEIGLHKKLLNRRATEFLCKECLAKEFRVSTQLLDQKIIQFRQMGCDLFEPLAPDDTSNP